eukprot:XP_011247683.1 PREDICTED: endogenous Bornavirus-like nucleoprotein 2 [Mus musculus]
MLSHDLRTRFHPATGSLIFMCYLFPGLWEALCSAGVPECCCTLRIGLAIIGSSEKIRSGSEQVKLNKTHGYAREIWPCRV